MREELAQLHKQNDQIRQACQSQREVLAAQRALLKGQQQELQRETERLKTLDGRVCDHDALVLIGVRQEKTRV